MNSQKNILALAIVLCIGSFAFAQKPEPDVYKGNEFYKKQQFDKAAEAYQQALIKNPKNEIAGFNSGNATFRQNKFDESVQSFDNIINGSADKKLQQQAYYNKGVAFSKQQKLEESIEAWKNALKMNPDDKETRENLEKALRELRKKQEEEKKQKEKKQQKKDEKQKEKPKEQSKLSQQRVEQLLKALQQKEKEVNDKMNQARVAAPSKPEKDW